MTREPRRLRELDGDASALLRGARPSRKMTAEERERIARKASLIAAVPVGVGLLAGMKGTALAAVIGVGAGVAIIAGGPVVSRWIEGPPVSPGASAPPPRRSSAVPTPSAPLPLSAGLPLASAPASSSSVPAPPSPSSAAPARAASAAPSAVDTLEQELQHLGRARSLLGASPTAALAELDAMERAFPRGRLGIEREMMRIEALLAAGRGGEARARAEALLPRVQGLPYESRVRGVLEKN